MPLEGRIPTPAIIDTPKAVNSCSSNAKTGTTVCVSNDADVYLFQGSILVNTLTSGGSGTVGFSSGQCTNCGVVIDSATNTAVIGVATSTGSGYQLLNLATNTFGPVIPAQTANISKGFSLDPLRHRILSPSENANGLPPDYQLFQTEPGPPVVFNFSGASNFGSANLGSAAFDCTTGIALSTEQSTNNIFITDLSQVTLPPGSGTGPGTWQAPNQLQSLPQFASFKSGTTGISVATGSHFAVLEDEFGTTAFGAIKLPSSSGSGTPAIVDWVVANMPNDPSHNPWKMAGEPHGLTAYVSPNTGLPMGVLMNDQRTFLAVINLQRLLAAPRSAPHIVSSSFDLVVEGDLTFIPIPF